MTPLIDTARLQPSEKASEILTEFSQFLQVNVSQPESLDTALDAFFRRYSLDQYPELLPPDATEVLAKLGLSPNVGENVGLSLVGAKLVDTSSVSWDHILEFRKDTKGREKLQRLRRLFTTNFEGKSQAYIEADLLQRLEEHEAAVKEWGFETLVTTIESFANMTSLGALGTGALLGFWSQSPTLGVVSGSILEISNFAVTLARRIRHRNQLKSHALSYVLDARVALTPRQPN